MILNKRLEFLDILRIFAFVSVLIGHKFYEVLDGLSKSENVHLTLSFFLDALKTLCWGGGVGVIVFFLISGYIITLVLQTEDVKVFLIKRIFRIYPLYVAAVLMEAIIGHIVNNQPYPPLSIWIPRLLLVGDFFNTPYALDNVEWTLRIEVLFYAMMALIKSLDLIKYPNYLLLIYFLITVSLGVSNPIPSKIGWGNGYITLFLPFLFMGSCIYLMGVKKVDSILALSCISYIFLSYLYLTPIISPLSKNSHFAALALAFFLVIWLLRFNFQNHLLIIIFSELTYSVYFFHNWLWPYLESLVKNYPIFLGYQGVQVTLLLFLICYFFKFTIERCGILVGKFFCEYVK
ncbi:acyltransferase family protein [Polynucleobacter sphagniphilus]|uniref:acyltransferase family protein n=1 Tax=Polynucleobacter sphagniphilus TaxID=1743169 RepID=UPI002406288E|nr:acyltransferase family protein [Polynucleobacter sphagniphilus]MDF9787854.1 peptidoglycan/LPS O-acetylase OafA/YrhL [Polynucleobacter sphagniphilus]